MPNQSTPHLYNIYTTSSQRRNVIQKVCVYWAGLGNIVNTYQLECCVALSFIYLVQHQMNKKEGKSSIPNILNQLRYDKMVNAKATFLVICNMIYHLG